MSRENVGKSQVSSGVPSLDRIIGGGFKKGSNIFVAGQPGAGKTTLGLQFLFHGSKNLEEPGIYVSFVESAQKMLKNALSFGWDFAALRAKVKVLDLVTTVGETGVKEIFEIMMDAVKELKAQRVVIDTLTALTTYVETKAEARTFIGLLNRFLEEAGCTSLSLLEVPWAKRELGAGFEEFLGDGLIVLESSVNDLRVRRRLYVPKMRGIDHSLECYDFFITKDGIRVAPIPSPQK